MNKWRWFRVATIALPLQLLVSPCASALVALSPGQLQWLSKVTRADRDAWSEMRGIRKRADAALTAPADPLGSLRFQGLPENSRERLRSKVSAEDAKRVFSLGMSYAVWGGQPFAKKARKTILRWAYSNEPQGKPIDDGHLEQLILGYELVRGTFPAADRERVDRWLRRMAQLEIRHGKNYNPDATHSIRLKNVGLIGFLLNDPEFKKYAIEGYRKQIEENLNPDGSSFDLVLHDAMHNHCYDLEALLDLARIAQINGIDLYHYRASNGASLPKAVAYILPYVDGRKTHPEWRKTRSAIDVRRAAASEKSYKPGKLFSPEEAARTLLLNSFFDPSMERWIQKFHPVKAGVRKRSRYLTQETLLFSAEKSVH